MIVTCGLAALVLELGLRVLLEQFMLAHDLTAMLTGTPEPNRAIINVISNTCASWNVTKVCYEKDLFFTPL